MKKEEHIRAELDELENAFDCNMEESEEAQFMEGEIDALRDALKDIANTGGENVEDRILGELDKHKRNVMQSMGYIRRLEWVLDVEDKGWRFWEEDE